MSEKRNYLSLLGSRNDMTFESFFDNFFQHDIFVLKNDYEKHFTQVSSSDEQSVICMDVPGVEKEDINIEVEKDILTIKWMRKVGESESRFFKRWELNKEFDVENISSELKNGVLRILIPRIKKEETKKIEVKVT